MYTRDEFWKFHAKNKTKGAVKAWIDRRATELAVVEKYRDSDSKAIALAEAMREFPLPETLEAERGGPMVPHVVVGSTEVETPEDFAEGDINSEIRWVHANLPRLVRHTPAGPMIVTEALEKAPSNGCVSLAYFAAENPVDFYKSFVTKLVTKTEAREDTADRTPEEADPGLEDLKTLLELRELA